MKHLYIFENNDALDLEPISLTRPVFDLRCGPFTMFERIRNLMPGYTITLFVRDELTFTTMENYPEFMVNPSSVADGIWLLGNVLWSREDISMIVKNPGTLFMDKNGILIAANVTSGVGNQWLNEGGHLQNKPPKNVKTLSISQSVLRYLWDFIQAIPHAMDVDQQHFPMGSKSENTHWINSENIYVTDHDLINPGVVIDASRGPVIIDKNVEINSFTYLQGPLYVGEKTTIHSHTQLKQSVIGPQCRIAGEVTRTIVQGFSNKSHYGYLGDAYIGEWVNLGAGTTNSNLKNNYKPVSVRVNGKTINTKLLSIGSYIGDHTKTAIGTLLNTGTVIGPGCNIVSHGFPRRNIPSFMWYIYGKQKKADLNQFFDTATIVKSRRGQKLTEAERTLYKQLLFSNID